MLRESKLFFLYKTVSFTSYLLNFNIPIFWSREQVPNMKGPVLPVFAIPASICDTSASSKPKLVRKPLQQNAFACVLSRQLLNMIS